MANNICTSAASGTYRNQFNVQYFLATYELNTPVIVDDIQPLLSDILDPSEKITVNYQSRKKGTIDIMTNFPLLVLAALEGLKGDYIAYIFSEPNALVPQRRDLLAIQFRIPIFDGTAKIFEDGDILETTFSLTNGVLTLSGIDNPFASESAKANLFRAQTILSENTQNVGFKGLVMLPNDSSQLASLQLVGTTSVQYTKEDLIAQMADEWVANLVPYQASDYLAIDCSAYRNVNLTAGASNLTYYYVTQQKGGDNGY